MALKRTCLGCGRLVRGVCVKCATERDRRHRAKRPLLRTEASIKRNREAVAEHRATIGDWCPGWGRRPAHPSADLTADHVVAVGAGGSELQGALVVRCRSCNAAKGAVSP